MEIAKQISETKSNNMENLIDSFINQLPLQSKKTITYYKNVLVDFHLFIGKEWREFTVEDCKEYMDYLIRVHKYKGISESNLIKKGKDISRFLNYLQNINIINWDPIALSEEYLIFQNNKKNKKRSLTINQPRVRKEPNQLSEIINQFLLFLESKNYSGIKKYKSRINYFQQFVESNGKNMNIFLEENQELALFEQISKYEKIVSSRVINEEIELSTATSYLRVVKLFVKFLLSKNLVKKNYIIPIQLRGRGNRSNEYVPKDRMIELMNKIVEHSNNVLRDLSIFLIILDTGCRPIEVCNLKMEDVNMVERTLSFECRKSERRKIKISSEVMEVILRYLEIRDDYNPNVDNLFLCYRGNIITSSCINAIFYNANIKAFGESLFPAKAFRHTYITNGLEENEFERVSKVMGHKDLRSTFYYLHRSKKRLLAHTLNKSPI
ncbi:site-specific integrase [Metabacillus litoralis]|uniref:tyrosine-type recombinase/integrase n=1 Tax=Metabacillus litoralis TaxID=152268 RepID=UPI00203E14FC|nr:site-specific integrase [Metabacillus litoralis]MCM3160806.1 site-specific integrase [Metabacillus litoralis]